MFRALLRLAALVGALMLVTASPASAVINGQPDGNRHPYVGVAFTTETFCSGTLISPTVFLTAGHCTEAFAGSTVYVLFDPQPVFDPDPTHPYFVPTGAVTGTPHTHPQYCEGCAGGLPGFIAYDVGVITLSRPVTDVGYGQLPSTGAVDRLAQKAQLTAVGYGVQSFARGGGQPQPDQFGTRYFAEVLFNNSSSRTSAMFLRHSGNPAQGRGGTCFGDSGGPIFAADQRTVLAVTSFGTNGVCAGQGYAQRIDRPDVLDWIRSFL